MALKKLPRDVQSILCASYQINTFNRAIEELVYNSLDAESTSIAIRIHIQDNKIQVIDNGHGILKSDMQALGKKHMTSKTIDLATLKSTPKNYGYHGESLAYIVAVSQTMKITSRPKNTDETWEKIFIKGKEKELAKVPKRPSQGTTVDIKGYLYNLNIQKKTTNVSNELNTIKLFLEQLSLVNNNISLSLRDDSKNEIIFKLQKKRDVYQTLSSVFGIDKNEVQELQVEKNTYKVKGLVGKRDKEISRYWVYLNGKIVNDSKLNKIINDSFKKYLHITEKNIRKSKLKNDEENHIFKGNIPFYFIFIICPYMDYDLSSTSKNSVVVFNNWDLITKLLQKLVQFYAGGLSLKEIIKSKNKLHTEKKTVDNINKGTRNQVKQIMDKILGNQQKKIGTSQVKNGVKGKLIKRKLQTKLNIKTTSKCIKQPKTNENVECEIVPVLKENFNASKIKLKERKLKQDTFYKRKSKNNSNTNHKNNYSSRLTSNKSPSRNNFKTYRKQDDYCTKKHKILEKLTADKKHFKENSLLSHPKTYEISSISKTSRIVNESRESVMKSYINQNHNIRNFSKSTKIKNTVNYDHIIPKISERALNKYILAKIKEKSFKNTYDLVQTIVKSQQENINPSKYDNDTLEQHTNYEPKFTTRFTFDSTSDLVQTILKSQQENIYPPKYENETLEQHTNYEPKFTTRYTFDSPSGSKLTFQSHLYQRNEIYLENNSSCKYNPCRRFISTESKENFIVPRNIFKSRVPKQSILKKQHEKNNRLYDIHLKHAVQESSYAIEFSKSNTNENHYFANRIIPTLNQFSKNTGYKEKESNSINNHGIGNDEFSIFNQISKITEDTGNRTLHRDYCNESYCEYNISVPNSKTNLITHKTYTKSTPNFIPNNETKYQITTYKSHKQHISSNLINKLNLYECDSYHLNKNNNYNENMYYRSMDVNIDEGNTILSPRKHLNIVFVSKSQNSDVGLTYARPLEICESVLQNDESQGIIPKNNSALIDNLTNSINQNIKNPVAAVVNVNNDRNNSKVHGNVSVGSNIVTCSNYFKQNMIEINNDNQEQIPNPLINVNNQEHQNPIDNFNFKDRLRFLPKGMSQIFEICHSKTACDYNLHDDYFENSIYNNFVNNIEANTEIYKPLIQNVKDITTKHIDKFNDKLKKDNASLIFDRKSLETAKVLGQVDLKFIAATVEQKSNQSEKKAEFLVLFDQHAVHERIRLEKNLEDYITEKQWNSKPLDNIRLKMTKDEVLVLHNYRNKLTQLGLEWSILGDCEVSISAIPEAILGKHPREVEKVIKAVRNLIVEEINMLKFQKGCVSMYPKSIMDLVFSEACRFAIKFGDILSKNECEQLLRALSECKTPFQCAHGRPVMAVLVDIQNKKYREYKVNISNIRKFKKKDDIGSDKVGR